MDDELFFDVDRARNDALEIVRGSGNGEESHLYRMALTNLGPPRDGISDSHPVVQCTLADWFISGEGNYWPPEVQGLVGHALYVQLVTLVNVWPPFGEDAARFIYEARMSLFITQDEDKRARRGMEDRAYTLVRNGILNMERLKAGPYASVWPTWFAQLFGTGKNWREENM